jgi:hypothetical protein
MCFLASLLIWREPDSIIALTVTARTDRGGPGGLCGEDIPQRIESLASRYTFSGLERSNGILGDGGSHCESSPRVTTQLAGHPQCRGQARDGYWVGL